MKKLIVVLAGVPVLLVGVLVVAFLMASRDIAPPHVPDLVPERVQVADAENAYTYLNRAAAAVKWPKDPDQDDPIQGILDGTNRDPEFLAALLAENAEVFRLIEQALECDVCQGPEAEIDTLGPVVGWRDLGTLLHLRAIHEQEAGRWSDATTTCCKLLRLGDLARQEAGCLTSYYTECSLLYHGFEAVEKLITAPDVPESELRRLAEALDRVGPFDQCLIKAIKGEYQLWCRQIDATAEGKPVLLEESTLLRLAQCRYCLQPNRTKALSAVVYRDLIENIPRPVGEWDVMEVGEWLGYPSHSNAALAPNGVGKVLLATLPPLPTYVWGPRFHGETYLAALRLIVACRRWEKDHGQLPPTLDVLVPEYLDAVPADPMDRKPLRYDRERAIVYSLGDDCEDAGGLERWPRWEELLEQIRKAEETGGPMPPPSPVAYDGGPPDDLCTRWQTPDIVFPIHERPKKDDAASEEPADY